MALDGGEDQGDENECDGSLISGLRCLIQNVFKDTETFSVEASKVYEALNALNLPEHDMILGKLNGLQERGQIKRSKLDDLIEVLEEVRSEHKLGIDYSWNCSRCRG